MSRLIVLVKKNLLRFLKNPKTIGFLIIIPIVYYFIIGLIFGGLSFAGTTTTYNIGFVDNDTTTATRQNFQVSYLNRTIDENIESINFQDFSSESAAQQALESGTISSYILFPQGFEESIEYRSRVNLAFYNNDTSTSENYSVNWLYSNLMLSFSEVFRISNVTQNGEDVLQNFNQTNYDSMLVVNEGFEEGLDDERYVHMTYWYRNSTSPETTSAKTQYGIGVLRNAVQMSYTSKSSYIAIYNRSIIHAEPFEAIEYKIYFRGDVSPANKGTIQNTLNQAIEGIINYNPTDVELFLDEEPFGGKTINQITYSAPGYLLYGPMTILSFVLVVLTGEKKDGIFKRLSSTQVKNWELILSNIISSMALIFMQFAIGAGILSLFGWDPFFASVFDLVVGSVVTMFIFGFFLLALGFSLAPVFKDPDTAGGGVWIIIIPLAMLSGIFVPIELFGEGMKFIARFLPPRFAVVALQHILLNGNSIFHPEVLLSWGLLLGLSAVIFAIGIRLFKKFISPG